MKNEIAIRYAHRSTFKTEERSRSKMCRRLAMVLAMGTGLLLPIAIRAQQPGVDTLSVQELPGIESGNYHVNFNFEAGYQMASVDGNTSMYDTLVNLHSGPRIFSQFLSMNARNHEGTYFDRLTMSAFGFGGQPQEAVRIMMSKDKWYDFNILYRANQNVWDYNVLANPLNPVNPIVTINTSPHTMDTRRNMGDYSLTLLPASRLRFRFAATRVSNQGPSYSSFHEGTDVLLSQEFRITGMTYRMGADYNLFKKTIITYDQTFDTYKGDTWWLNQSQYFPLSDGSKVDIGLPYNPPANQPCSTPFKNGFYNPTCNGYFAYSRVGPVRSFFPTEQIALQSHDIKRLDLSGRFAYSSGYSQMNDYNEQFSGLVTRTNERQFTFSGPANTNRVIGDGDAQATYHITDKLAVSDIFRWYNSRAPGDWNSLGTSCFPNGTTSLLTPIGTFNSPGITPTICAGGIGLPNHGNSNGPDIDNVNYSRYQNLNYKWNTVDLEYTMNRIFGAHAGYRFADRQLHTNNNPDVVNAELAYFYPLNAQRGAPCTNTLADGTCVVATDFANEEDAYVVHQNWGLFGVWVRPISALRINAEINIMSASGEGGLLFTRMEPRHLQSYQVRARYTPKSWLILSGTLNWQQNTNFGPDLDGSIMANNQSHNRYFGFDATITPREMLVLEFGYNYNDVFSGTNVCLNLGTPSLVADPCYADSGGGNTYGRWNYSNTVNSGYFNFILRPMRRLAFAGGLNLVDSTGNDPIYLPTTGVWTVANPLQPLGSLSSLYWRPTASLAVGLGKGWEAKGGYGYYDYHERGYAGPILPRNFHSNTGTVSVKYSF